jgi:hypothetical protein
MAALEVRQQRRAVFRGPAVILHMRDLQPFGADFEREVDQRARRCAGASARSA